MAEQQIPDDIMQAARDAYDEAMKYHLDSESEEAIARALLAERRRSQAVTVPEPAWWLVATDMGKVIFHGPDKGRADRVAAIQGREAKPLYEQPVAPVGWTLVPKEPTPEMIKAGDSWSGLPSATWADMLDAAPIPPAPLGAEEG